MTALHERGDTTHGGWRDRYDRRGYLAAAWAAAYGTMALIWTVTGHGYPFGRNDPAGEVSLLRQVPPEVGAPLFAGVLLVAAVAALAMASVRFGRLRCLPRALLLGCGWAVVAGLLIVVPDARLLILAGYAPMILLGWPFGWPAIDHSTIITWPVTNKVLCVVGGLLLARALVTWQFRTAGACVACGRRGPAGGWTSAAAAARWGRWAVGVAAAIPLMYAVTRFAWLANISLGVPRAGLDELRDSGAVWAGAGLGAFATVGAVLTLGLVQRWGEVFPRWMIGLAGRPVPITLAVLPATLVAVFVTSASAGLLNSDGVADMLADGDMAILPMLLWPVWGAALAAAAMAYYLRRRPACAHCAHTT